MSDLPFAGCMQVLSRKLFLPYRHKEYGLYFCVESITCMYVLAQNFKEHSWSAPFLEGYPLRHCDAILTDILPSGLCRLYARVTLYCPFCC